MKKAGAKLTNPESGSQWQEITIQGFSKSWSWNKYNINPLTKIYWRASLVPAAAVIQDPEAYIKVVAVEKLVVGFRDGSARLPQGMLLE